MIRLAAKNLNTRLPFCRLPFISLYAPIQRSCASIEL
jgi:hypothetical protein